MARQEHQEIRDDLLLSSTVVMVFRASTYAGELSRAHPVPPPKSELRTEKKPFQSAAAGGASEDEKGIAASPLRAASR
jgi:hypothetical protein